ncbi:hypothetical protein [Campylobacter mucosalis]|uniref:hypothetical protein n=1 Tax=Campylobacter mucosalis TaxID=202 RepID=UPI0014702C08|nr:hypothetical protein [Campylobacter mucosalis]
MNFTKFQAILVCIGIPIIIPEKMGFINMEFDDVNQKAVKDDFKVDFTKNRQITLKIKNSKEICECMATIVSDRFSDDELSDIVSENVTTMHLTKR